MISKDMRCHEYSRINDRILRHAAEGLACKSLNTLYLKFAKDVCSVKCGLATDGFDPYRPMNTTNIIWPIVLIPYNLPSICLCRKPFPFILSIIISGKERPKKNIYIYISPLIHEL